MLYLVGEHSDEALGLSLQVQVHVVELPVQSFVNLLFAFHSAWLLHGPLHTRPVQVLGQVAQENTHMLHVVQGNAELSRKPGARVEEEGEGGDIEKEKLEAYKYHCENVTLKTSAS